MRRPKLTIMLRHKQQSGKPVTQTPGIPFQQSNLPFEIRTIHWMERNRQENHSPHRHGYYEITWIKEGSGTYLVDLEKHEVAGNSICCAAPGQVHQLKAREKVEGYVLSFNNDFLLMAQDRPPLLLPATSLSRDTAGEIEDLVQKIIKEYDNFFLLRAEILIGFFKIFLIYLARQSDKTVPAAAPVRNTDLVKKFFSIVNDKFITHKKVTEYAEQLAVTPNYLNEIVKKVSGFPASHHIQQRIVLEAKRHATYSNSSMKEIAYHLGFDDIAHFSKFFKNVSGQSFTDFRKQALYQFDKA